MTISNKNIRVSVQDTILAGLIAQLESPTSCSKKPKPKTECMIQSPHSFCAVSQVCIFQDILLIKKWQFPIFTYKELKKSYWMCNII